MMEFSGVEVSQATKDFCVDTRIGEGGFGSVYRGTLRHTQVAIKRLSQVCILLCYLKCIVLLSGICRKARMQLQGPDAYCAPAAKCSFVQKSWL